MLYLQCLRAKNAQVEIGQRRRQSRCNETESKSTRGEMGNNVLYPVHVYVIRRIHTHAHRVDSVTEHTHTRVSHWNASFGRQIFIRYIDFSKPELNSRTSISIDRRTREHASEYQFPRVIIHSRIEIAFNQTDIIVFYTRVCVIHTSCFIELAPGPPPPPPPVIPLSARVMAESLLLLRPASGPRRSVSTTAVLF